MIKVTSPVPKTYALRTSHVTEVIKFFCQEMEILTGLSTFPETQTFLVLIQYFRNLGLEPTTAIRTSIRGNKPWTSSSSLFLGCRELCWWVNPASCRLTGSPNGRQAGQTFPPPTVTTKGTCCVKGFATVSQPSKCLASCCCLLMGPKLVTREISSIQSFPNLCWWNLSNPIAFYDSKWSFSTASLLS